MNTPIQLPPLSALQRRIYVSLSGAGQFTSLTRARDAASAGDVIHVVDGTHIVTDANLAKNQVSWHLYGGVVIQGSNSGANPVGLFDDEGTAMEFRVSGEGDIQFSFGHAGAPHKGVIRLNNANSMCYVSARRIRANDLGANDGVSVAAIAVLNCKYSEFHVDTLDTPDPEDANSYVLGVYWEKGECHVNANIIWGQYYAVWCVEPVAAGTTNLYVNANVLRSRHRSPVEVTSTSGGTTWATWIKPHQIINNSSFSAVQFTGNGGKLYIEGVEKIDSTQYIGCLVQTGEFWMRGQKITSSSHANILLTGGNAIIRMLHLENTGTTHLIECSGGTHDVQVARAKITNGKGIVHSGGTLRFSGRIDTSNTNSATNRPVEVSGAGLQLVGSMLIAPALADGVYAGAAQNVQNLGSGTNRAPHVNVTIQGEALVVSALYT
jgi:hypothetical protein